jgi:hypothetical protein
LDFFANEFELVVSGYKGLKGFLLLGVFFFLVWRGFCGVMMEVVQPEKKMFSLVPGDYKLLEEVGQGVSATVYRAVFEPLNEVVAIKSLDLERCNSNLVSKFPFFLLFLLCRS